MKSNATELSELILDKIKAFKFNVSVKNTGIVIKINDGVVKIFGLSQVVYGEMLLFEGGEIGLALNLEADCVGAIILGESIGIKEGTKVECTSKVLSVPVGSAFLGRVVDALGRPIDGLGPIEHEAEVPIERAAPGVMDRNPVNVSLHTGIKCLDSMIPIGRGQRELIIGDRQTGKTYLAIDTIINQKDQGVYCIYVAIGQKLSSVVSIVEKLKRHGAMDNTIVVVASASEAAALQYIAPYAACSMGEYFRDKAKDALIVYDDLTKHAWAYRQISLLLRRPPGREAYPGDVFYLHSRLLERSSRINSDYLVKLNNDSFYADKTGSLTAIPIIETQAGDVSAFVPTNVISITDGQIFLETNLFNMGIRPAVNAGISVSRVGGAAQSKIIKSMSGGIRLALAQYRELVAFSQFSSDLDRDTRIQLERGSLVTNILKQAQHSKFEVWKLATTLLAINSGLLDSFKVDDILDIEKDMHCWLFNNAADLCNKLEAAKNLSPEDIKLLETKIKEFTKNV